MQEDDSKQLPASTEGVTKEQMNGAGEDIPPVFQNQVMKLLSTSTAPELEYVRDQVVDRLKQLTHAKTKSEKSDTFDTEGMPD